MTKKRCWDAYAKHGYRQFVVANIDLLGQRQKLWKMAKHNMGDLLKDTISEELEQLQLETFVAITHIRDFLDQAILERQSDMNLIEAFDPVDRPAIIEMLQSHAVSQNFSDSLVYHVCTAENLYKPAATILNILHSVGCVMLMALSRKQPLRGGIEFHWAGSIGENEIYGPAPFMAYYLESHVAQYPRVVIGTRVIAYLNTLVSQNGSDHPSRIARNLASVALSMISLDTDGAWFLDYLGDGYRRTYSSKSRHDTAINFLPDAYSFIVEYQNDLKQTLEQQSNSNENKEISKQIYRYQQLKDYFDSRQALWVNDGFKFLG